MTARNHECYVSLEVSKLLKDAGFNWECRGYFDGIEFYPNGSVECTNYNSSTCKYLKVPVLDVAQRWLREVKNIDINILAESISSHKQYLVSIWFNISSNSSDNIILNNRYTIYEEAQEAGEKKALEMILEKGE
jgi:hypothetical protein